MDSDLYSRIRESLPWKLDLKETADDRMFQACMGLVIAYRKRWLRIRRAIMEEAEPNEFLTNLVTELEKDDVKR